MIIRHTTPDPLTVAMIGAGVAEALAAGCPVTDIHDGEDSLILDVISHAHLFDAEWQRRYGKDGINPDGAPFNFYMRVAKPFGAGFARLLARDPDATPTCLLTSLFDAAEAHKRALPAPPDAELAQAA